jgi:hypothetical protein
MDLRMGRLSGDRDIHPLSKVGTIYARFVLIENIHLTQNLCDVRFHWLQVHRTTRDQPLDRGLTPTDTQQIMHDVAYAYQREQTLVHYRHGHRSSADPVLRWSTRISGKRGDSDVLTMGTWFLHTDILSHDVRERDIHHLPLLT